MTQYKTDFTEYTVDVAPSDWTEQWTATNSDWIIRDNLESPSGQVLEHDSTVDARRALSWDDIDADAERQDSEILVKLKTSAIGSGFQFYIRLRGSGSAGSETSYNTVLIYNATASSSSLQLHKYVSGVSTNIGSSATKTIAIDTFYFVRFRVNGSDLKAKIWVDGDTEPASWDLEQTDTAITGDGFVGVGSFESDGTRTYDFFSAATNGGTAEGPDTGVTDARVTQTPILALAEGAADTRVTQTPVLVMYEPSPPARVTQTLILALHEVIPDVRATQVPVLALIDVVACLTKWAQTWTITRTDGEIFAFTSLDRDLTFRGVIHKSCDSLSATATEMSASSGSTGSMELQGLISDSSITDIDLFNGLFDGALVEIWSVPWEDVGGEIPFRLLAGTMGDVTQGLQAFSAEIITPGATMQQKPLLDVYTPACRYKLGDARCGFDLSTLEVAGSVTSLVSFISPNSASRRIFKDSGRAEADRFYEFGEITWTSGDNVGVTTEVKDFSDTQFVLWEALLKPIKVGDTYTARPGCDKSESQCKTKFNIFVNYGGFPDVPGEDRLVETPDAK